PGVPKPPGVTSSAISLPVAATRAGETTCSATRCSARRVCSRSGGRAGRRVGASVDMTLGPAGHVHVTLARRMAGERTQRDAGAVESDRRLVAALRAGDEAAFMALVA